MKAIYIAGRFEARDRLRHERNRIHLMGAGKVVSTWLDEETSGKPTPAEAYEYAIRDRKEILCDADLLILDTFDEDARGGREVEFGIALGLVYAAADYERSVESWIVGPKRNVFHELAPHFDTWDEVLDALMNGNL